MLEPAASSSRGFLAFQEFIAITHPPDQTLVSLQQMVLHSTVPVSGAAQILTPTMLLLNEMINFQASLQLSHAADSWNKS